MAQTKKLLVAFDPSKTINRTPPLSRPVPMPRYSPRTLLILLAIGPPLVASPYLVFRLQRAREWDRQVNCSNGYISPAIRRERTARQARPTPSLSPKS
jgi:hypothetical protein